MENGHRTGADGVTVVAQERGQSAPTLADAIREGLSRREALRLGHRLASEVASSHARGMIHGALTPRSILLDRSGGLEIVASDAESDRALYLLRYASPEVARREDPTNASDVFSLTLIVREIVEGIPARRAEGEEVALEAIDGRVSVPHEFDGELKGLVALGASPHPDQRPTAAQFAAAFKGESQVRSFGKQEWLVAFAAVAALLMLVFLLRRAAKDRDLADQQVRDSRAAIEGLLAGTYPELGRVQSVEVLADAGERALASLEAAEEWDADTRVLIAKARMWNGELQLRLGADAKAREHFERAIEVADAAPTPELDALVRIPALVELSALASERHDDQLAGEFLNRAIDLGDLIDDPGSELNLALGRAEIRRSNLALTAKTPDENSAR